MKAIKCAIVFALALSEVACGGDTTHVASFSSGLPKDTPGNALSDAQLFQLCSSVENYFAQNASLTDDICRAVAAREASLGASSDSPDDVQPARDACNAEMMHCRASLTSASLDETNCAKAEPTCTATVGDEETCFNDSIALIETMLGEYPQCDALTASFLEGPPPMTLTQPASCQLLFSKCPGGFGEIAVSVSSSSSGSVGSAVLDGGGAP